MSEIRKSYWSVTPAEVRYCKELGGGDPKHLYGEISALCNERGYCWASNSYFAELYGVDVRTVSRWISLLEKHNFITIPTKGKKRKIYINQKFAFNNQKPEEPKKKPKKKKEKRQKVYKFVEDDMRLAELLLQKVILNHPWVESRVGEINLAEWAEDIRRLREIEKATPQQIEFMINWIHGGEVITTKGSKHEVAPHEFWSGNVLSASKLRKQWFENLIPQLQSDLRKKNKAVEKVADKSRSVQM